MARSKKSASGPTEEPTEAMTQPSLEPTELAEPGVTPEGEPATDTVEPQPAEAPAADEVAITSEAEPVSEPESERPPAAAEPAYVAPPAQPAPPSQGGGFVAGLLGGALAVAAGVGGLWLTNPDLIRGRAPQPDLSPLEARLDEAAAARETLEGQIAALGARLDEAPAAQPSADGAEVEARVGQLESDLAAWADEMGARIEGLSSTLSVLEGRVAQVEARPPVMEGDAGAVTGQMIDEMRAALEQQRAEVAALTDEARTRIEAAEAEAAAIQAQAEASARAAVARAAMSRLRGALDAGGPFSAALADLSSAAGATVPESLQAVAESGVPTVAALQAAFPEAARAGLAASVREDLDADAGTMERLGAFLRAQTGARSITPRDGDDPDAILSRAEAALAEGRVADALALVTTLPPAGQDAMADWVAAAQSRLGALDAAEALSASLPAN